MGPTVYRKMLFTNLKNTNLKGDLGNRISLKNAVPSHLLSRSRHLEKVAVRLRKEQKKQTKVTLKNGGLYLFIRDKGEKDWHIVEEDDLVINLN